MVFKTQRKILYKDRRRWTEEEREKILAVYGYKCFYCKIDIVQGVGGNASLDHAIPISRGGKDVAQNLVASCKPCNRIKGHLTAKEFLKLGGRKNRTIPYGYKPSTMGSISRIRAHALKLPAHSRTRDALLRMLKGEKVDYALYPAKLSASRGIDRRDARIKIMAKNFPDIIKKDGLVYWINPKYL